MKAQTTDYRKDSKFIDLFQKKNQLPLEIKNLLTYTYEMTGRNGIFMTRNRIESLSLVRWPLALWVILHHSMGFVFGTQDVSKSLPFFEKIIYVLYQTGSLAPQAFIIVSGFVIAKSFESKNYKTRRILNFYFVRFASLYPLYLICLIIAFFTFPSDRGYFLSHVFLIQSFLPDNKWFTLNGPGWSISAEFFLYLIFPLVYKLTNKVKSKIGIRITLSLVILVYFFTYLLICIELPSNQVFYLLYHFPPFLLFHFTIGILLYKNWNLTDTKMRGIGFCKVLALIFVFIAIYLTYSTKSEGLKLGLYLTPAFTFVVLVYTIDKSEKVSGKFKKFLVYIGEGAFTLYITHWLWLGMLRNIQAKFSGVIVPFIIFLLISIAMSILSAFIQRNVVNEFKKYLTEKKKPKKIFLTTWLMFLPIISFTWPNAWLISTIPHNPQIEAKLYKLEDGPNSQTATSFIATFSIRNKKSETIQMTKCYIVDKTSKRNIQISQPYPYMTQADITLKPNEISYFSTVVPRSGNDNSGSNTYLIACT